MCPLSRSAPSPGPGPSPYPASTVLIMLDINSRWPTHTPAADQVPDHGEVHQKRILGTGQVRDVQSPLDWRDYT